MTVAEIAHLRVFLLLTLNAAGQIGMQAESMLTRARVETFDALTLPELELQLRVLADERKVVSFGTALGQQRWKITGLGNAALQEARLA